MSLTLYHMQHSRSLRPLWLLEEIGVPYTLNTVERSALSGDDFMQKSNIGKVPVFFDGDKRLTESIATIQYIDGVHNGGKLSRKPGDDDYHDFLQMMEFGEAGMGGYAGLLVAHTVLLPPKHQNPAIRDWAKGEINKGLCFIEGMVREDKHYLLGDFSLADISIAYMLYLLKITKNAEGFGEKTNAYFKRVARRDAWVKASAM